MDGYQPEIRAFLDYILRAYETHGVQELASERVPDFLRIRYGGTSDAKRELARSKTFAPPSWRYKAIWEGNGVRHNSVRNRTEVSRCCATPFRLLEEMGSDTIRCYDEKAGKRHTTVELIEETAPWRPRNSREQQPMPRAPNERVLLKVEYGETALRERVRQAGGYWMPDEKAWSITSGKAAQHDLTGRIVGDI